METIQKMGDAPSGRPDNLRQFGVGWVAGQPNPARGGARGRQPGQREGQSPFGGFGHKVPDSFFVAFQPQRETLQDLLREATVSAQAPEELRFAEGDYIHWGEGLRDSVYPVRPQQKLFSKQISPREMAEDCVVVGR